MLWGPYPALIDAPGKDVHGVVYEVQSPEEKRCLQEYETDHYREARCLIKLEDGTKEIGRTFKWNEDFSLLRKGSFDLKDWLLEKKEQPAYYSNQTLWTLNWWDVNKYKFPYQHYATISLYMTSLAIIWCSSI